MRHWPALATNIGDRMPTLAEALRGALSAPAAGLPSGDGEQTSQLQRLLRTKSGIAAAGGGPTPRASALGEAAAAGEARVASEQQAAAGRVEAAGQEQARLAQETESGLQRAGLEEARLAQVQRFNDQLDGMLQQFGHEQGKLELERDASKAEQLGFAARLSSEKYTDELERAAAESRLADELSFRETLQQTVFGDELALLKTRMGHRDVLSMDRDTAERELGAMDLDFALEMAKAKNRSDAQVAQWGAIGGLASGGIQAGAAAQQGAFSSDYQRYKDEGGRGSYGSKSYQTWEAKENAPAPRSTYDYGATGPGVEG